MTEIIDLIIIISLILLFFSGKIKSDKFPSILKNFPSKVLLLAGLFSLGYTVFG